MESAWRRDWNTHGGRLEEKGQTHGGKLADGWRETAPNRGTVPGRGKCFMYGRPHDVKRERVIFGPVSDAFMYTACLCVFTLAQMIFAEGVPLTTSHLMCRNNFGFSPSPVCPVSHLFFALFATFGGMVSRSKLISMPGSARRPGFC